MAVGKTARNERIKLLAGLAHSAATTCLAVGVVAPLAAKVYNPFGVGEVSLRVLAIWLLAVVLFHGGAQIILGRPKD